MPYGDGLVCLMPFRLMQVIHCTLWIYHTSYSIDMNNECSAIRDFTRRCLNLKKEAALTTDAGIITTESSSIVN